MQTCQEGDKATMGERNFAELAEDLLLFFKTIALHS